MESVSRKDARGVSNSRPINPNKAQRQGKSGEIKFDDNSNQIQPTKYPIGDIMNLLTTILF